MSALSGFAELIDVMATLRGDNGCPWDRAQTFETIAPYTIEEAYEVADAIANGTPEGLCEELGDLLLQVVFHARIAEDRGLFTLADVTNGIVAKMRRRHPHIFGAGETPQSWEDIKAAEKPRDSALDGIARALPALMRAAKMQRRLAKEGVGTEPARAVASVKNAVDELVRPEFSPDQRYDLAGDLLFALTGVLAALDIDPEAALRDRMNGFERDFRRTEARPVKAP